MRFVSNILGLIFFCAAALVSAAEFQVSTIATNDQEHVAVTTLTNGMVIFAWEHETNGVSEIWFRRYDQSLLPIGVPTRAHPAVAADQVEPAIAPFANGFVITWAGKSLDPSDYGIGFRRFDTNGNALDAAVLVANTTTNGAQTKPDIAPLTTGGFVIVWNDQSGAYFSGADQDVRYRRFSSAGIAADPSDLVANAWGSNARILGNQGGARVASLPSLGFVVVYEDREVEDVFAVRFDGSGNPQLPSGASGSAYQQLVNTMTANAQWSPAVSSFSNGTYVVSFNSETNGTPAGRRVLARVFQPNGGGSNEVALGSFLARMQDARVAALSNGHFVVAMQGFNVGPDVGSNAWSVIAQRGRTNNVLLAPSFIANSYQTNDQERPAIAATRDGGYVLAWQSFGQDGSRYGIYAQKFTAAGEPGPGTLLISRQGTGGTNLLVRLTNGTPYALYRLQSANLVTNWVTVLTTNPPSGNFDFQETPKGATVPRKIYRAVTP
jgi:hypothetical protein